MRKRHFSIPKTRQKLQKLANSNEWIGKNYEKPPFLGILGRKFWSVFSQKGQNRNFFKKVLGKFFSHLQALIKCKFSEKGMDDF